MLAFPEAESRMNGAHRVVKFGQEIVGVIERWLSDNVLIVFAARRYALTLKAFSLCVESNWARLVSLSAISALLSGAGTADSRSFLSSKASF